MLRIKERELLPLPVVIPSPQHVRQLPAWVLETIPGTVVFRILSQAARQAPDQVALQTQRPVAAALSQSPPELAFQASAVGLWSQGFAFERLSPGRERIAADPAIEQCVCAEDSFCCESEWDALCISEVNEFGCGTCDVPDPPSSGSGGGTSEPVGCLDDGMCTLEDDCVCTDCDADMFCSDPANCVDDGMCDAFNEGCVCADCASHPECSN